MKSLRIAFLAGWIAAIGSLSCTTPEEPVPGPTGKIVLKFESPAAAPARSLSTAAASFDSVVVRVFHPGTPPVQEVWKGQSVADPGTVQLTLSCVAESGKRVSVELFSTGVMTYHGANTDVRVTANRDTAVGVDAYPFTIASLSVSPPVIPDGAAFSLRWDSARAAAWYKVQSSSTPDFASIEWEQTIADTVVATQRAPGVHYFRVIPKTLFASGSPAGPEEGYVYGGSSSVRVTGFNPIGCIPGETFVINGENLDVPGTRAWIGPDELTVESAVWNALLVRMPLPALTNKLTVVSGDAGFGSDTSSGALIALRVAYVTNGGVYENQYESVLASYAGDFGNSGVVAVPVAELDTRDMDVFDIIIVADDTGTSLLNWGGGQPSRAAVIANSPANVLAIGRGGAVFLALAVNSANVTRTTATDDGRYYVPDGSARVFSTPHSVGGGFVTFSGNVTTTSLQFSAAPAGTSLYASTDATCIGPACSPNNRWALADFRLSNLRGTPVVYFLWGYGGDPKALTSKGSDCLGNVMNLLYTN